MFKKIYNKLKGVNILKTIYINFAYLPLKVAIKLPIFIYSNTLINNVLGGGKINIEANALRTGILSIGTPVLGFQSKKETTVFRIKGVLNINGKFTIGKGCAIEVCKNGILTVGENTMITGKTTILCTKEITIGDRCMISWDNLIMDSDWHNVVSKSTGEVFPKQKPITIGKHVWIGCRCTILKGVNIADEVIIAANSTITKSIPNSNVIVCSKGIIKEDVTW